MRPRTFVEYENCGQYRWTTGFGWFVCMSDSKRFKRVSSGTCCVDMAILPGSKTRSGYVLSLVKRRFSSLWICHASNLRMETSMAVERIECIERMERQARKKTDVACHGMAQTSEPSRGRGPIESEFSLAWTGALSATVESKTNVESVCLDCMLSSLWQDHSI